MIGAEVVPVGQGTKFPLAQVLRERALALLRACDTDKEIPYDAIVAAMGADPRTDRRARGAFLRAADTLLEEDRRGVENVRDRGYRIYRADEHRRVAKAKERRGVRHLRRAVKIIVATALDGLPPAEVALVLTTEARLAMTLAVHKKLSRQRALPPRADIHVPKADSLVAMFTKKSG